METYPLGTRPLFVFFSLLRVIFFTVKTSVSSPEFRTDYWSTINTQVPVQHIKKIRSPRVYISPLFGTPFYHF